MSVTRSHASFQAHVGTAAILSLVSMLTIKLDGPTNIFTSRITTAVFRLSSHMRALNLLLVVEDSSDDDVLEGLVGVQSKSLRNGFHSFGSEVSLRVHVHDLSSAARIYHNAR